MSRVIAAFAQFFDSAGDPIENGWLKFYESGSNNTLKNTYADVNQTIANANPLQLDAAGRCPNCFGQGIYRVALYEDNPVTHVPGTLVQLFDPVVADYIPQSSGVNFGDWSDSETYQVGNIVFYQSAYYRSTVANNLNFEPITNLDKWEKIDFLRFWNADTTYQTDDLIVYEDSLYFSFLDANIGNQPDTSPGWWIPVGATELDLQWVIDTIYSIGDIAQLDGIYYRSIVDNNLAFSPDTNADKWEVIDFLRPWNTNVSYATGDLVIYDNLWYGSLTDSNQGNTPSSSPASWELITEFNYWEENGTAFRPKTDGYNLGDATNGVGTAYIDALGVFTTTPDADPDADLEVANKRYVDESFQSIVGGFKNKIINGNFDIWQRGTSLSATGMAADRWRNVYNGSGSMSVDRSAFSVSQTDVPTPANYYMTVDITTDSSSSEQCQFNYKIEDITTVKGVAAILSFYVKADSALNMSLELAYNFGSGGSSTELGLIVEKFSVSTSWQKISIPFTFPQLVSQTLGTGHYATLLFYFSAGSDYDSRTDSLGNQSGTFDIAQVQLEKGSQATEFEQRPIATELALCQRYYEKSYGIDISPGTTTSYTGEYGYKSTTSAAILEMNAVFKVVKRTSPTITIYSPDTGSSGYVRNKTTSADVSVNSTTVEPNRLIQVSLSSSFTAGQLYHFHWTADAEL